MLSTLYTTILSAILCHTAVGLEPIRDSALYADQMGTCLDVARAAAAVNMDIPVVVALAWSESRFKKGAISKTGAFGPLQVTKFWCPHECKDSISAGVRALRSLVETKKSLHVGLCHYACGNICSPAGERYSRHIQRVARQLGHRTPLFNKGTISRNN